MSTRSRIAMKTQYGRYRSIYCHFDGYPEYVGAMLAAHYTDENKIKRLIDLGSISSLGAETDPPETLQEPAPSVTVAYYRDRGERTIDHPVDPDLHELGARAAESGADYLYLWENGTWRWTSCASNFKVWNNLENKKTSEALSNLPE